MQGSLKEISQAGLPLHGAGQLACRILEHRARQSPPLRNASLGGHRSRQLFQGSSVCPEEAILARRLEEEIRRQHRLESPDHDATMLENDTKHSSTRTAKHAWRLEGRSAHVLPFS
jgi:hypothetical protein